MCAGAGPGKYLLRLGAARTFLHFGAGNCRTLQIKMLQLTNKKYKEVLNYTSWIFGSVRFRRESHILGSFRSLVIISRIM